MLIFSILMSLFQFIDMVIVTVLDNFIVTVLLQRLLEKITIESSIINY